MRSTEALQPDGQPRVHTALDAPRPLPMNTDAAGAVSVRKALAVLEFIAERGGASARIVSQALEIPLPTVYRILMSLVDDDYLVHLRAERRYELGYKLHRLGASLHQQVGVTSPIRSEIAALHQDAHMAAYFAVYRGPDVIVAHVDDCPEHPRLKPLRFGMHEATHATAFGKIMLAGMAPEQRDAYLSVHGMAPLTATTLTRRDRLEERLREVALVGIAWEHEEFVVGTTCAAIAVRSGSGTVIGSVAVSAPTGRFRGRESETEVLLRNRAARLSRYFRTGKPTLGGASTR